MWELDIRGRRQISLPGSTSTAYVRGYSRRREMISGDRGLYILEAKQLHSLMTGCKPQEYSLTAWDLKNGFADGETSFPLSGRLIIRRG